MCTGDNRRTAESVAHELGIDEFKAEVMPDEKIEIVKDLKSKGAIVAMAGDGINDAPALAAADVGIAMGTGTDVAIESASITLVKGDLMGIVKAIPCQSRRDAKYPAEFIFRVYLQRAGCTHCRRGALSVLWFAPESDDCRRRDELSSVSVILNALRLRSIKL